MKIIDQVMELITNEDSLLSFTNKLPYGLVLESGGRGNLAQVGMQRAYSVLTVSSETHPLAVIPALERVKLSVEEDLCLTEPFENHNLNELTWLYSFSKAKKRIPSINFSHLCGHVQEMWLKIATLLIEGAESGVAPMYAICFAEYGHPMTRQFSQIVNFEAMGMWDAASSSASFFQFTEQIGIKEMACSRGHTIKLTKPRKRVVVHRSYGRIEGVMATTQGPLAKTVDELKGLALWSSENPLMFAEHDQDRPIGLIYNPHFIEKKSRCEVKFTTLITNEEHWLNRDRYTGSSLGVYHG